MQKNIFIDVAVELPLSSLFTYRVPEALHDQIGTGKRVLVPFGRRVITGFCVAVKYETSVKGLKDALDVLDDEPLFDEKRLRFYQWMANYYFAPPGEILSLACPAGVNIKSRRYFYSTGNGHADASVSSKIFEALENKKNGASLSTLLKMFKGKSVYSAINRLKQAGLIREELHIKRRVNEKKAIYVSINERASGIAEALDNRLQITAPLQAKALEYLFRHGETSISLLRRELGGIDHAIRRLQEKGLVNTSQKSTRRDPLDETAARAIPHKPSAEQEKAIEAICHGLAGGGFAPFLLYGVTGSGKTFIYLKAIEKAVEIGRQAIYLVPEISLTSAPVAYLAAMFPERIAVLHSGLSDGERYDEWNRIRQGRVDVVVGARSALFAPLKKPGIIIVDEEHEQSYKQEEGVRYNARDASLMMGKMQNLTVVLGSATPSIETFYNATNGRLTMLHLSHRVEMRPMPDVEIVDIRAAETRNKKSETRTGPGKTAVGQTENALTDFISDRLNNLIAENLRRGNQTILLLNRRGFSNFMICRVCGHTFKCQNCSVSLTLHRATAEMKCHYCDLSMPIPEICPECGSLNIKPIGIGTEQLEAAMREAFKDANVGRMDRDTTRKKRAHQKILDAVDSGQLDILVGTQMVAKGHHFPNVTLVGIISADTSLNIPDFRSNERLFQLITQAAGRAGRGQIAGRVIVQSLNPGNEWISLAARQDYAKFYREELENRKALAYPPFSRIAILRLEGDKDADVESFGNSVKKIAERLQQHDVSVLGPAPAFLSRLRGKYRRQILLKGRTTKTLHDFIEDILKGLKKDRQGKVMLSIDIDPASTI